MTTKVVVVTFRLTLSHLQVYFITNAYEFGLLVHS
jgi:hypothetical protein